MLESADLTARKARGNYLANHIPRIITMDQAHLGKALSPGHPLSGERVLRIPRLPDIYKLKHDKKIGTWNVRSLFQAGKVNNVIKEMQRLNIDILGCSEVRWPNLGQCEINDNTVYNCGDTTTRNKNGVAIIVNKEVKNSVLSFIGISDRVAILKINAKPFNMNIIQAYAPTSGSSEQEVEVFYEQLKAALKHTKKQELNLLMGDFNAKVGKGAVDSTVGQFGLGTRNDRGDRLIQFCQEVDSVIMNTFFQLPPRRLYTWKSPADCPQKVIRNQIDYIIINKRFQNSVKSTKAYPGADVPSDHNLLLSRMKLHLKKVYKGKPQKRPDIQKLKDNTTREEIKNELNNKINSIATDIRQENINVEDVWNGIKNACSSVVDSKLKAGKRAKKQPWMTEGILELMEERRKHRNKNDLTYREINKIINKKIKEAKELWLQNECMEIESLEKKHDTFNLHKKIKAVTGGKSSRSNNSILDTHNNLLHDNERILERWREYMEELFEEEQQTEIEVLGFSGPEITLSEVRNAIKRLKNNKSPGPDNIHGEILKLFENDQLKILTRLLNKIYETGEFPGDWLASTFIPLPKKANAITCSDYRIISLLSL